LEDDMIIIGEKINGAIPAVAEAIEKRDDEYIRSLARKQVECRADYLDICAGTRPELEYDALCWLIDLVQETVEVPLCVDSPNPRIFEKVLPRVKRKNGIINSVSMEKDKCEIVFPLIEGTDWQVIALTCDNGGVSCGTEQKVAIADRIVEKAAGYGIGPERIYVDPLVLALSTANDSMLAFMDALRRIKERHPTIKSTSGLSNISFGMPYRKAINVGFLILALSAGMDSAIIDSTNKDTYAAILSAEALLGKDRYLRNYIKAFREGRIGPVKAGA
jgi:5-methyltetrahydrofolate--homocysteine methyltransferase